MTEEEGGRPAFLSFALEGARVRQAATVLEREAPRLAAALRRAVPFLSRRRTSITLSSARTVPLADLMNELARPAHLTQLLAMPGHAGGALLIDAGASALLIDGILGGDGHLIPELNPAGLSAPQAALVGGLARNIVRAFSAALQDSIGVGLEARAGSTTDLGVQSAPVACVLDIGEGEHRGQIALLVPREPLLAHVGQPDQSPSEAGHPGVTAVLDDVELLLVVELGRVSFPVGRLAALTVGDTLRLDVPVSSLVSVRADGHELMRGRPTNSGGRIGVKVVSTTNTSGPSRHET